MSQRPGFWCPLHGLVCPDDFLCECMGNILQAEGTGWYKIGCNQSLELREYWRHDLQFLLWYWGLLNFYRIKISFIILQLLSLNNRLLSLFLLCNNLPLINLADFYTSRIWAEKIVCVNRLWVVHMSWLSHPKAIPFWNPKKVDIINWRLHCHSNRHEVLLLQKLV